MEHHWWKKIACIKLGIFLAGVQIYLRFFAPVFVKVGVETTQIDKILHIIGGVFFALFIEWRMKKVSFWRMLVILFILSLAWKGFEFIISPAAQHYILTHLRSWSFDLTGDVAATVLGGLLYWRFAMRNLLHK